MKTKKMRAGRLLVSVAAVLFALTACGKKEEGKTVGQSVDAGIAKTEQLARQAEEKAAASLASAGDAVKQATKEAEASGSQAAGKLGEKIDDIAITALVSTGLAKDPELSALKINVDTKAGVVTLNGPAPSASAKDKATDIARQVKGVVSVNNLLVVKAG